MNANRLNNANLISGLISIVLFLPLIQYFIPAIIAIVNHDLSFFVLSQAYIESAGVLRYSKDLGLLVWGAIWPFIVLNARNSRVKKQALFLLAFEAMLLLAGVIGHVINPLLVLLVAGLRWLMLLHAAGGMWLLPVAVRTWEQPGGAEPISRTLFMIIVLSFLGAFIQFLMLGNFALSGARYSSFYANAGVLGYSMVGAGTYFLIGIDANRKRQLSALTLCFLAALLSGSRSPMFIIFIMVLLAWLMPRLLRLKDRNKVIPGVLMVLLVASVAIIPVVELAAQRGALIENLGEGGRFGNLALLGQTIYESDPISILFGKGFGYGTNSAAILAPDLLKSDPWFTLIDNTFATLFLQVGLFGVAISALYVFAFGKSFLKWYLLDASGFIHLVIIVMVMVVMSITQNIFEAHLFLLTIGLSMSRLQFAGAKPRASRTGLA